MTNLRITKIKSFKDNFGTGDYQTTVKYEVRRDFTKEELSKHRYAPIVIDNGVVIETFNSETNAEIFLNALNKIKNS